MVIGACQVELSLPGVNSLKGKRSIVRRVIDRTANRFNVAVAEVDDQDVYRRGVIGFAVVSSDARHANQMLDKIVSFVSGVSEAVVMGRSMEIIHLGRDFGDVG